LPQTGRVMVKDEDVCVHCGLCAERCPTAAWDMEKFEVLIPLAGRSRGGKPIGAGAGAGGGGVEGSVSVAAQVPVPAIPVDARGDTNAKSEIRASTTSP